MQIGNNWGTRTRGRENKTNHNNRASDELVFPSNRKEEEREEKKKHQTKPNQTTLGSSELTRKKVFHFVIYPEELVALYVHCHSDKLVSQWFWQNRQSPSGPASLLADLPMSQAASHFALFPLKMTTELTYFNRAFQFYQLIVFQQTPV